MNEEKDNIKEYVYRDEKGDAHAVVYQLFPGIEVAYISVHMAEFDFGVFQKASDENYASIHYCGEGRIEQEGDHEFFYLMPGDCSVAVQDSRKKEFRLPLKYYRGICIGIDLDESQNPVMVFMKNCGYAPIEILKHICGEMSRTVLRSSEPVRKFFEELYEVESTRCMVYLRVKFPELFYRMIYSKSDKRCETQNVVSCAQVDFVKSAVPYILKNINEKITVKRLTQEFGVSDTYLQNAFRSVYGMPVISFIRVQKMQSAAQVLRRTSRTIEEIAEEFGYENESKFSAAFKRIMGDSPGVFRKTYSEVKMI